jgi:hypothetical protein
LQHSLKLLEGYPAVLVLVRVVEHQLDLGVRVLLVQLHVAHPHEVLQLDDALAVSVVHIEHLPQGLGPLVGRGEYLQELVEAQLVEALLPLVGLHQGDNILGSLLEAQCNETRNQLLHRNDSGFVVVEQVEALLHVLDLLSGQLVFHRLPFGPGGLRSRLLLLLLLRTRVGPSLRAFHLLAFLSLLHGYSLSIINQNELCNDPIVV